MPPTAIPDTKRCLITEKTIPPKEGAVPRGMIPAPFWKTVHYTTDDCPVYELEKCATPADPGLQGIDMCATVIVEEIPPDKPGRGFVDLILEEAAARMSIAPDQVNFDDVEDADVQDAFLKVAEDSHTGTSTLLKEMGMQMSDLTHGGAWNKLDDFVATHLHLSRVKTVDNRIKFRLKACGVKVKGDGESFWLSPEGTAVDEGSVDCTHTAVYTGTLDELPIEEANLAEMTAQGVFPNDPALHFGALWSYVQGIAQEGIANVFAEAAGAENLPAGFNRTMSRQVYRALETVAPAWAEHQLLPAILEEWRSAPASARNAQTFGMLNSMFDLMDTMEVNPAIKALATEIFGLSEGPAAAEGQLTAPLRVQLLRELGAYVNLLENDQEEENALPLHRLYQVLERVRSMTFRTDMPQGVQFSRDAVDDIITAHDEYRNREISTEERQQWVALGRWLDTLTALEVKK
jgi:hypothetical protein